MSYLEMPTFLMLRTWVWHRSRRLIMMRIAPKINEILMFNTLVILNYKQASTTLELQILSYLRTNANHFST